jgi:hypothetical protein
LFKFKDLGEEFARNGTMLIGRAPHIARLAWLHSIYPVLNDQEIAVLENEVKTRIPPPYREFLTTSSNGLGLFVGTAPHRLTIVFPHRQSDEDYLLFHKDYRKNKMLHHCLH